PRNCFGRPPTDSGVRARYAPRVADATARRRDRPRSALAVADLGAHAPLLPAHLPAPRAAPPSSHECLPQRNECVAAPRSPTVAPLHERMVKLTRGGSG